MKVFATLAALVAVASARKKGKNKSPDTSGCDYPAEMPDPFNMQFTLARDLSLAANAAPWEQPVIIRGAHMGATCSWNCVAAYTDEALDSEESDWLKGASEEQKTTETRAICLAQCWNLVEFSASSGLAFSQTLFAPLFRDWGFTAANEVSAVVSACGDDRDCLLEVALDSGFDPKVVGQIIAAETNRFFANDGWNADGAQTFDFEKNEAVPTTANRVNFEDTTGYRPVNYPGKGADDDKYEVSGVDARWQPIRDFGPEGYTSLQNHVTPHIGAKAHHYIEREYKQLDAPNYDYRNESLAVVERLRVLAETPLMKESTVFFDNKPRVRSVIQAFMTRNNAQVHSFEDQMLFIYSISVAEYEALLQAWYNKLQFDLVRPTTVINRWGDDDLVTYNRDTGRSSAIKARDFASFIRVMPHSEFPSGSACLCTAYAEFTNAFVQGRYNQTTLGPLGFITESGFRLGWLNIDQMAGVCGQSRLWGGMHFTRSVDASIEACTGIGGLAYDLSERLRNGSNYAGNKYFPGAPRVSQDKCELDQYTGPLDVEGQYCKNNRDCGYASSRFYCDRRRRSCTLKGQMGDWCHKKNPCAQGLKCVHSEFNKKSRECVVDEE